MNFNNIRTKMEYLIRSTKNFFQEKSPVRFEDQHEIFPEKNFL